MRTHNLKYRRQQRGLSSRRRSFATSGIIGMLTLLDGLYFFLPTSVQAATGAVGYQDQSFSGTGTPTGTKRSESVLWWNDGSWWADMFSTSAQTFHISRLNLSTQTWPDKGLTIATRSTTHADV